MGLPLRLNSSIIAPSIIVKSPLKYRAIIEKMMQEIFVLFSKFFLKSKNKNKQTSKTTIEASTGWKYTKVKFFKFIPHIYIYN